MTVGHGLKLYVAGEHSGNPDDWSEWSTRALVVAKSPEEALSLVDWTNTVTEVEVSEATLLMRRG